MQDAGAADVQVGKAGGVLAAVDAAPAASTPMSSTSSSRKA